jgi:hypothetical protein
MRGPIVGLDFIDPITAAAIIVLLAAIAAHAWATRS